MQQSIALLILIAFFTQTFSKVFIVADYFTNTASFAKNCENKNKPMMHCNGKCQMMKKLKQEENRDTENPHRKGDNKDEVLSSKSFFASVKFSVLAFKKKYSLRDISLTVNRTMDIFHPPQRSSFS